jgi:hypothetical protein
MIDLKNRTRETKVYQYPRDVSAGPVRPQVMKVHRGRLNPKNGEKSLAEQQIAVGGVLTLPPKGELKQLPDALLNHPALQRDIKNRKVLLKQRPTTTAASQAPAEPKRSSRTRRSGKAKE